MKIAPEKSPGPVAEGSAGGPPILQPAPTDVVRDLRLELHARSARLEEVEGDLRAAEDQVHRLEAELRLRSSRIAELLRAAAGDQPDGAMSELAKNAAEDAAKDAATEHSMLATTPDMAALIAAADAAGERAAAASPSEASLPADGGLRSAGEPPWPTAVLQAPVPHAPEGASRFLVLMDGDNEVVHLLGRRTTLGRGPDNDIQIDQQFVSRAHALILAGPNQTVIEDLRSTNGLLVNGQRLRRSVLADGDVILIGKTQFRFARRR